VYLHKNSVKRFIGGIKYMGSQAKALIAKFGGDYTFEELIRSNTVFNLSTIKKEYPGSVKGNTFTELDELANGKDKDSDAKKAIKLLLQVERLNDKNHGS
jgi:hypothetical protein